MFQIKDGKITLNKTRVLTPKQIKTLEQMHDDGDRNRYLMSLMGLLKSRVRVNRIKSHGRDVLHDKPKSLFLKQMQRLQNVERDHEPSETSLGQWVGVEIECIIPHQDGACECECRYDEDGDIEYECQWCENGQQSHWNQDEAHSWIKRKLSDEGVARCCVKDDGSLNDDDGHGVEITILFNSAYGFEPLKKLCKVLSKIGCYVNDTCGLHVHLDARHLTPFQATKVGASLGHALPVLKWLVPESRHNNGFCKLGVSKLINISRHNDSWDERYHAINLTAYPRYKTIEVRLHGGSINASKIESWVTLLKIIGSAKLKQNLNTFQDLIDLDGMTESMIEYCEGRITALNPESWPKLMAAPQKTIGEHIMDLIEEGA